MLLVSCTLPWAGEKRDEINLIFSWQNNQIILQAAVDGRSGQFIVGSAQPQTVLDSDFGLSADRMRVVLGDRYSTFVTPVVQDLGAIADGILGADAWRDSTLTIDYQRQLVIVSSKPAEIMDQSVHHFDGPPTISIFINGKREWAVVDIALPDTLVLPVTSQASPGQRTSVALRIDQHDLGKVDAGFARSSTIRIGNRLLSRFLIQIDYRRGVVTMWRDPRSA